MKTVVAHITHRQMLFITHRDKVVETLRYIATNVGSGDHDEEIEQLVVDLLKDLGEE